MLTEKQSARIIKLLKECGVTGEFRVELNIGIHIRLIFEENLSENQGSLLCEIFSGYGPTVFNYKVITSLTLKGLEEFLNQLELKIEKFKSSASASTQLTPSHTSVKSGTHIGALTDVHSLFRTDNEIIPSDTKYLIFVCYIHTDGFGDINHMLDICKHAPADVTPVYIIGLSSKPETKTKITDILNKSGLDTESNKNIYLIPFTIISNKPDGAYQFLGNFSTHFNTDSKLQKKFKQACGAVVISTNVIPAELDSLPLMTTYISEYNPSFFLLRPGQAKPTALSPYSYYMGLDPITSSGMLLDNLESPPSLQDKVASLLKISNHIYLQQLLDIPLYEIDKRSCAHFVKSNAFLPGYFKNEESAIIFIQSMATSNHFKEFDGVTFHINILLAKRHLLDMDLLAKHGFSKVEFISPNDKEEIILPKRKGKTLRIISVFWLNIDDFHALYRLATKFGAGSGDKTYEQVFSNGLIPFITNPGFKANFFYDLSLAAKRCTENKNVLEYIKLLSTIKSNGVSFLSEPIPYDTQEKIAKVSQLLRELLNSQNFISEWEKIISHIRKNYNFYKILPSIFEKNISFYKINNAIKNGDFTEANRMLTLYTKAEIKAIFSDLLERAPSQAEDFQNFAAYLMIKYEFIEPTHSHIHTLKKIAEENNYSQFIDIGMRNLQI